MTVAQLRKVLDKYGNDDAIVWINVSGTFFPMCGRVKSSVLTYERRSDPGNKLAERALVFKPCECTNDDEDQPDFDGLEN